MTQPSPRPEKKPRSTYERALDMLEARARGATELRRLLLKKGEPEADVDETIARLQRAGLIDDAVYARQFARSKALGAGLSRRRLQQELTKRGVAQDVTSDAIEDVFADEEVDEDAAIERVARKKLRMLTKVDDATRRRRLYSFLARRGYESEDIGRVMRLLLETAPE
ncbi:MAG TPA: regulatory protein RecX [Gemmatimonadaceae bacterium]